MYQELQAIVCYMYEQVKEKAQGHSAQEKVRALSVIQPFKTPIHAHICTHESFVCFLQNFEEEIQNNNTSQ